MKPIYDVIVIGAGPIGSYTAYQLADKGFKVCLFDEKEKIGEGVICSGVISKEAFKRYDLPTESILSRVDAVSFISPGGQRLDYEPQDVFAYVVDRGIFDNRIFKLAKRCGVDIHLKHRVSRILDSKNFYTVYCNKKSYRTKFVVLATGVDYTLQKNLGLGSPPKFLYGSQIEVPISFASSKIDIHIGHAFAPGSFGWVIPVGGNSSRIGTILHNRGNSWLKRMLEKRLKISTQEYNGSRILSKPIAYGSVKKSVKGNIISVGEAAGQVKTTTGGGIFYGLLCSEIAVDKLTKTLKEGHDLSDYEISWRSALISEIDIGIRLRSIAARLSDGQIENLFSFVKQNRFWVELLVPRINFDYHSNFIFFCLKSFAALLGINNSK